MARVTGCWFVAALALGATGCMESTRMSATSDVMTERPTITSLRGRQSALYDDGRCPAGEIAQFTKRGGQAQLMRQCVLRPG